MLQIFSNEPYLEMLPSDEARQQVCECLIDPDNYMRVHQELLLIALGTFDYPRNYTADQWWRAHANLFRPEYDVDRTVMTVRGWTKNVKYYRENGFLSALHLNPPNTTVPFSPHAVDQFVYFRAEPCEFAGTMITIFADAIRRQPLWQKDPTRDEENVVWWHYMHYDEQK